MSPKVDSSKALQDGLQGLWRVEGLHQEATTQQPNETISSAGTCALSSRVEAVWSHSEHLQIVGGDDLGQLGLQQRRKVLRTLRRRAPIPLLWRAVALLWRPVSLRRTAVLLRLTVLRLAVGLLRRVAALLRRRTILLLRRWASCRSSAARLLNLRCQAPARSTLNLLYQAVLHRGPPLSFWLAA
jgi:hypothetical protein